MGAFHPVLALVLIFATLIFYDVMGLTTPQPSGTVQNRPSEANFPLRLDRVICNYDVSVENRAGDANFTIQQLDVQYCTDLYYDYVRLDSFPVESKIPTNFHDWPFYSLEPMPRYVPLNYHKMEKPGLVTFLTVCEGDAGLHSLNNKTGAKTRPGVLAGLTFKKLAEQEYLSLSFSTWAVYLLRLWGFDGLALRWPADKGPELLHNLLRMLRSRFNDEARSPKRGIAGQQDRLKLAVLLNTNKGDWLRKYDMHAISKLVDQITLEAVPDTPDINVTNVTMATRILQPLFYKNATNASGSSDTGERLTIDEAVQLVIDAGVTRVKVNVAISLSGLEYTLEDPNQRGMGALVKEQWPRPVSYYDICSLLNNATLERASPDDKSPYFVDGSRWISFEDEESISQKVEYLKAARMGGVALFSQSDDDTTGKFCGQGKLPLSSKAFQEADVVEANSLLLLPWQRYCSGQHANKPLMSAFYWLPLLGFLLRSV